MHYKLAVFGDSYADRNGPHGYDGTRQEGWEKILCDNNGWQIGDDSYNIARAGSGNWWTYCTFEKFIKEHTADIMIFSMTTLGRIPLLHESGLSFEYESYAYSPEEGMKEYIRDRYANSERVVENEFAQYMKLWDQFNMIDTKFVEDTGDMAGTYPDLTRFVNIQTWNQLIKKCKELNQKAIFLLPFSHEFNEYITANRATDFPIIYGIDTVSAREMRRWEQGWAGVEWSTEHNNPPNVDSRTNHLTQRNNQMLAYCIQHTLDHYSEARVIDFNIWPGLYLEHDCLDGYGTILWQDSQLS